MEKRISFDQFQSVKRVAQACNPLVVKRDKIRAKIEALAVEFKSYDTQISSLEAGIKQVVGFRVEELVKKVIEPGVDANGQPKKTTKWLPTDMVSYDEKHKQYVITTPDAEATDAVNTAADECKDPATPAVSDDVDNVDEVDEVAEEVPSTEENVPTDAPIFE